MLHYPIKLVRRLTVECTLSELPYMFHQFRIAEENFYVYNIFSLHNVILYFGLQVD